MFFTGYPDAAPVMATGSPAFNPSTVTPKTICVRGVSSICIRGSGESLFDSRNNTRPSSAFAEADAGKLTEIA